MRRWDVWINIKSKVTMKSMKITITTKINNREWNHDIQEEQEDYKTTMKVEVIKRYFNSQLTVTDSSLTCETIQIVRTFILCFTTYYN